MNEKMNEQTDEWMLQKKWVALCVELCEPELMNGMNERMNAWMNEQTNEQMNKWMNERANERTNEWTNKRTNEWMNEQTNEWINEWMNQRTNEWINEWMNQRTNEWMKVNERITNNKRPYLCSSTPALSLKWGLTPLVVLRGFV